MIFKKTKRNILLIVQRDNFKRDDRFIKDITREFEALGYQVRWHNPANFKVRAMIDPQGKFNHLPLWLRVAVKGSILIRSPYLWPYVFHRKRLNNPSIPDRCKRLKNYINSFGSNANLIVLSRSAGARVASIIADEVGISKLICIGYPFKHPDHPAEPERYEHLADVKTPILILQGDNDIYGGKEITSLYQLGPNASVSFIEASHDFKLSPQQWQTVLHRVKTFIAENTGEQVAA